MPHCQPIPLLRGASLLQGQTLPLGNPRKHELKKKNDDKEKKAPSPWCKAHEEEQLCHEVFVLTCDAATRSGQWV